MTNTRIAVAGSVATDHLMRFAGRFAEQLLAESLHRLSVSFLVDDLQVRYGGVAGNIAYGLGLLGRSPLLVAAVGDDFADYRAWLEAAGVDTSGVHVSSRAATARFVCTTDADQCQIASFYPGAMSEAAELALPPLAPPGGFDLVVISPDDPVAMLRHTEQCREQGWPFVADPSQQLTSFGAEEIRSLLSGAAYLFTNEYERDLLDSKMSSGSDQATTVVTTLGAEGVRVQAPGAEAFHVGCVPVERVADPTGAGDAFRAGFLAARSAGHGLRPAARLGSLLGALALESVGTQEYRLDPGAAAQRLADAYGGAAAEELRGLIGPSLRSSS